MIVIIISCLQMALCSLSPCLPFFLLLLPLYALSLRRMLQCLVLKYYLLLPCVYIMWGTYKCHRAHILVSWQFWGNHFTPTVNFRFWTHFFQLEWDAFNRHLLYLFTDSATRKEELISPLISSLVSISIASLVLNLLSGYNLSLSLCWEKIWLVRDLQANPWVFLIHPSHSCSISLLSVTS